MIDTRILVGLISMLIAIGSVVWVGINEADRQATFKAAFAGREIESGAALFGEYCSPCHGIKGQGIPSVAPELNSAHFFNNRLDELGYQGSLESYVNLTIASGRPVQSTEGPYPQSMPTWSVDYGGPLRNDQVRAVTAYVMHWEENYEEGEGGEAVEAAPLDCESPAECGEILFQNLGCVGCHAINGEGGAVGPDLTNVYSQQGEDYVSQSIMNPNAVVPEGFQPNIMPQTFGQTLSDEELAGLIAYLASVSE